MQRDYHLYHISARDLPTPYPTTTATPSGLPDLEVSLILRVWGLNYSLSSMHLFPIFQRHFHIICVFFFFNTSSDQLVYFIVLTCVYNTPLCPLRISSSPCSSSVV